MKNKKKYWYDSFFESAKIKLIDGKLVAENAPSESISITAFYNYLKDDWNNKLTGNPPH